MQRPRMRVAATLVCLVLVGFLGLHQLKGTSFGRPSTQAAQRRRLAESSSDCLKEAQCPHQSSCGPNVQADSLPYTVSYSKAATNEATMFTFKVCSTGCSSSSASCKPLERFLLRLDSNLLANTEFFKSVSPAGSFSQCSEAAGLGYSWSGSQLAALKSHDPAQGEVCQDFSMEIYHESEAFTNLWLTDICQQGVKFIDASGVLSEPQSSLTDMGSCIARLTIEEGASAIKLVADQDFSRPLEAPAASDLSTDIHRVMAELDGPRRQLLQAPGAYGYSYSPAPYGYYGSPAAKSPPVYGYGSAPPPTYSAPPPSYGGYGAGYYGYGSYGYGSYGYGAPTVRTIVPSVGPFAPSVTLFGPLSG